MVTESEVFGFPYSDGGSAPAEYLRRENAIDKLQ